MLAAAAAADDASSPWPQLLPASAPVAAAAAHTAPAAAAQAAAASGQPIGNQPTAAAADLTPAAATAQQQHHADKSRNRASVAAQWTPDSETEASVGTVRKAQKVEAAAGDAEAGRSNEAAGSSSGTHSSSAAEPGLKSKFDAVADAATDQAAQAAAAAAAEAQEATTSNAKVLVEYLGPPAAASHLVSQWAQGVREAQHINPTISNAQFEEAEQTAQHHGLGVVMLEPEVPEPKETEGVKKRQPRVRLVQRAAIVPSSSCAAGCSCRTQLASYAPAAAVSGTALPRGAVFSTMVTLCGAGRLKKGEKLQDICQKMNADTEDETKLQLTAALMWCLETVHGPGNVAWGPLLSQVAPKPVPEGKTVRQLTKHSGITKQVEKRLLLG